MTSSSENKRLYKSRSDRMIDGVCGGVAEYFGLDSTLVRIAWVLLTLFGGSGIILYILAMIIMPPNHGAVSSAPGVISSMNNQKFWGVLLLIVGGIWLLSNLGLSLWHHWWDLSWDVVLAVVLILAGVAFLFGGRNYVSAAPPQPEPSGNDTPPPAEPSAQTVPRRLYRSRVERKLAGVCGGLGTYFSIDPTIVRLLFVVAGIASFGFAVLAYIIMAIVVHEEPPVVIIS